MNLQGRDLKLDLSGDDVRLLHTELAQLGLAAPDAERQRALFGPGTRDLVLRFQRENRLEPTGVVDAETARAINQAVDTSLYTVEGTVSSPDRAGVDGLRVEVVDKNAGPDVLLAKAVTDERGRYRTGFSAAALRERRKRRPDLQARAYSGQTFLGASAVRYNAANYETLNVRLPAQAAALPSEHETLTAALKAHVDGELRDLKESDDRQDVTYLANKTGWDARAVALAALADQFSQASAAGGAAAIQPAFFYALFRAGLPANADGLYQADTQTVTRVWKQAVEQGVIPQALANELPRAAQAFQALSAAHALDARALAGTSTLKELLRPALGDDAQRQQQFAALQTRYRDAPPKFWEAVRQAFGNDTAQRLQLDGQLAYLTLNNAPVIGRLREAERQRPLASTLELAQRGYYRADKWAPLLDGAVPEPIPGATPEQKRARYAELLATQVRLSFPTAVVAEMVRGGELPLDVPAGVRDGVHAFLTQHQGKFEIGMHPVEQYLARNNLGDQVAAPVKEQIKRLQRVYQITLTDQAIGVLLKNRLDSAYQVVRYDEAEFVRTFGGDLGGEDKARLTYAKARQVHTAVLNVAGAFLTARRAPKLGADPNALVIDPTPVRINPNPDVIAYPTLEGLFGSMDYCACGQCRSILSPAAYLVDLLLFLDRPVNDKENPQAVLLERRPDLRYLPLTCENTNTPLPYIDVVNETLEYFVTHNLSLANYTGHDTGDGAAEDLLAGPRFVNDAAYDALKAALFPPPLPFHRPLEALRRHFDQFEIPLQQAMEALRANDAVERANPAAYGWRDILMEQLKLSRTEHTLLTDRTLTLQQLYGYPAATPNADVLAGLAKVKAFARRAGVTYADVVELLKTRFINPAGTLLPRLERLGVPFATLKALKDGAITDAAFDALLPPGLDPAEYGGDVKAWVKDNANYARIMGLITVANPTNSADLCSLDQLEFRHANPDNNANALRPIAYVRLLRLIRLWKKLGLSVELTDRLITALYPVADLPAGADDAVDLQHLDHGFLTLLPRLGVVFQVLGRLNLSAKKDLPGLLACWAPIDTYGAGALYRKMFLSPALLRQDPAFADDGYGNFLRDNNQKVLGHAEALRAAFNLTGEEFGLIVAGLGFNANTPLTLDNVSAVYRRGWLARKLRLSVREFLLLTGLTGLDPFAPPDPPNPPVVRLLRLLEDLRAAGLKPVQALYLIWNQDLSGKSAPEDREVTDFARTLRAGFAAVESEFAVADDPDGAIARARMALVYGGEATDFFFGLLENTLVSDVPYSHAQAALEQPIVNAGAGRLGYDDFRKRLSYAGVLDTATRDALKAVAGVSAAFRAAVDALYAANQAAVEPFFARYPELRPLHAAYAASADPPQKKRTALLANFLPELKRRRKRQQALAAVSAAARADATFAQAVLDDAAVLHAAADNARPALDDLTAVEAPGLSAQFFWRDTATGAVGQSVDAVPTLAYAAGGPNPLPANPAPGNAVSGLWTGYLEAPENGFYNLAVETDAAAAVTLTLGGQAVALAKNGNTWANQNPIALTAGTLYPVALKVEKVTNALAVRWQTTGRGVEVIPARYLYPATSTDRLRTAYVRFLKAAALATALKLTARETAHLAAHADYRVAGQGWLNALPVSGDPAAATAQALRDVLAGLLAFARLKAALAPDDERLLDVLRDPNATLPNGDSRLLTLTGWERSSLNALLARFGKATADLAHLDTFRRVADAYDVVTAAGISAAALLAATTNEPDAAAVRDFQSALRARYDEADWLAVLRPLNDALRGLQRDALVAYVLQKFAENPATRQLDTPDKLFEYFLMDVQTEPCLQTSRVRHALSSVQLFTERCLLNLEPRVAPSSIKAGQWEWMKRYRVWEANRKVFLWPENWLEPELRDDQSPFFKEAMSELLQSDITEDTAATALLNYLTKLEEVAKLEPCGIHYAENDPGAADDVAHVVARTAGAHRKYYYRRRASSSWTPWEPIKLDIEDNPVIPVVWKGRVFLFWLRILKQTPLDPPTATVASSNDTQLAGLKLGDLKSNIRTEAAGRAKVTVQAVLCWSEYYNGKWQPAKTSDPGRPTVLGSFDAAGTNTFDRSQLQLAAFPEDDALRVSIFGSGESSFLLYNTHSLPVREEDVDRVLTIAGAYRYLSRVNDTLSITYSPGQVFTVGGGSSVPVLPRDVLRDRLPFTTVEPRHELEYVWDAPFFFADSRHVFYVTTSERIVWLRDYTGYGVPALPLQPQQQFPPLVMEPDPRLEVGPSRDGAVIRGPGFGVVDPAPVERFVTGDGSIRVGLGTGASVRYGDRDIGPGGVLANGKGRPG
jgi:peptidoglycan hydrolase-like protein with peptidoglycan-binding domain